MRNLDDLLRSDPHAARCYRALVSGEEPLTVDAIASCYGEPEGLRMHSRDLAAAAGIPFEDEPARAFSESAAADDELLGQLRERLGVKSSTIDPAPAVEPTFADPSDERWDRYLRGNLGLSRARADETVSGEGDRTTSFGPPPELIAVPEDLVQMIDRTFEAIASHGFLSEEEFERRASEWLSRESGA